MRPSDGALLETDLIRSFVAISDAGSFTAAAQRVFRTPSAISMQMKKLETQLGRPLFVRHARSVSLTPDGEAFLTHCRRILRLNEEALARFRAPQLEGRVRFGALDDFGTRHLPEILTRFAATHPLVDVDVTLSTTADLLRKLAEGEVDLALSACAKNEPSPGETVHTEPLIWVGKRGGSAHGRSPVPLAMSAQGCPWRAAALRSLDDQRRIYRIAYTCENGQGQLAAVGADLAVAPLPASLLPPGFEKLGERHGYEPIGEYQLKLDRGESLSSAGEAFARHVKESFAISE